MSNHSSPLMTTLDRDSAIYEAVNALKAVRTLLWDVRSLKVESQRAFLTETIRCLRADQFVAARDAVKASGNADAAAALARMDAILEAL